LSTIINSWCFPWRLATYTEMTRNNLFSKSITWAVMSLVIIMSESLWKLRRNQMINVSMNFSFHSTSFGIHPFYITTVLKSSSSIYQSFSIGSPAPITNNLKYTLPRSPKINYFLTSKATRPNSYSSNTVELLCFASLKMGQITISVELQLKC
jgi:hypothetical protein